MILLDVDINLNYYEVWYTQFCNNSNITVESIR